MNFSKLLSNSIISQKDSKLLEAVVLMVTVYYREGYRLQPPRTESRKDTRCGEELWLLPPYRFRTVLFSRYLCVTMYRENSHPVKLTETFGVDILLYVQSHSSHIE